MIDLNQINWSNYDKRYAKFLPIILTVEGGYVNDPDDAGGETNYGISKRFLNAHGLKIDLKKITAPQVADIYYTYFYEILNIYNIKDELLALHVFDFGVNSGAMQAARTLQKLLNVKRDGKIGKLTIAALEGKYITPDYIQARINFYYFVSKRNNNQKYLSGWIKRVNRITNSL